MSYFARPRSTRQPGYIEFVILALVLIIVAIVLFPVFLPKRNVTPQDPCLNNARRLIVAVQIYQQNHNGQYPNKATFWQDIAYPPKAIFCPTYSKKVNGYGYNANLSGLTFQSPGMPQPPDLPALADSQAPGNLLHTTADIDFRHTGRAIVGFGDGHVAIHRSSDISVAPINVSP